MGKVKVDSTGIYLELSSEELNTLLSTSDIGESLYEILYESDKSHEFLAQYARIIDVLIDYIPKNRTLLTGLSKNNGVSLTLHPGEKQSVVAISR